VTEEAPGREIGPYRLEEVLGEGGMGTVWLAEQTRPVQRQVALKIIKLGMDTREVVARFETERQALAVMDHPNIAQVFDAGATDAGRPYFVMELVRGLPLTEYCDAHRLSLDDRIRLFQDVCRAVQHAHQKGIIHRDLKPSNVLVTETDGRPHPKIIDFGIARATETVEGDESRLTRQDHQIGTPAYMSPEQILGQNLDIDTRSDIYALGVLLYELLTGTLPFSAGAYTGPALLAQLTRETPTPSSRFDTLPDHETKAHARGTDRHTLHRRLKGDLDWIVLKAMAKERDRRYETANGLNMDLGRFLADEPVLARPPSAAYRAQKFVRRHRATTVFAGLALLLGVGFVVVQTVQSRRIRQARDLADARRVQAEGLIDFMLGDLRGKLEPIGRLDILGDVGDQAMAYFATLPEDDFTDSDLMTRSKALYQIGEVRLNEGDVGAAVGPLQESLRLAQALQRRAPEDADRLFQLAQSHFWLGYAHWLVGNLDQAETEFGAYLDNAESLVALDEENRDYRMELGYAHSTLGSLLESRGDLQGAVGEYLATQSVQELLVREDSTNLDWKLELAETFNKLGVAYRKLGRYPESLDAHHRELALKEALFDDDPRNTYYRFRLSTGLDLTAEVQLLLGDLEGAEENTRASLEMMAELATTDASNAEWKRAQGVGEEQLAELLLRRGAVAEAGRRFRAAAAILQALGQAGTSTLDWRVDLGRVRGGMARMWIESGAPDRAMEDVSAARILLADSAATASERDRARAEVELVAGRALEALGRTSEARKAWTEALGILEPLAESSGGGDFRVLRLEAYMLLGQRKDAEAALDRLRAQGLGEPWILAQARKMGLASLADG